MKSSTGRLGRGNRGSGVESQGWSEGGRTQPACDLRPLAVLDLGLQVTAVDVASGSGGGRSRGAGRREGEKGARTKWEDRSVGERIDLSADGTRAAATTTAASAPIAAVPFEGADGPAHAPLGRRRLGLEALPLAPVDAQPGRLELAAQQGYDLVVVAVDRQNCRAFVRREGSGQLRGRTPQRQKRAPKSREKNPPMKVCHAPGQRARRCRTSAAEGVKTRTTTQATTVRTGSPVHLHPAGEVGLRGRPARASEAEQVSATFCRDYEAAARTHRRPRLADSSRAGEEGRRR